MPGDEKHNAALKRLGLIDDEGKPTWFTDGRPDPVKELEIAGPRAAQIPVAERMGVEHEIFGTQGSGAFAVLADPKVLERIRELRKEMGSEAFKNRYGSILEDYQGTAVGTARQTLAEFNVSLMRLGDTVLPSVTHALSQFSAALEGIQSLIPASDDKKWKTGTGMIWGGIGGAVIGSVVPGVGTIGGAAAGAIVGGGIGSLSTEAEKNWKGPGSKDWKAPNLNPSNFLQGPTEPPKAVLAPITLNLNVDGTMLASVMSRISADTLSTQAPAFDGMGQFVGGDHNYPDK
jgi:hypothetical protein